MSGKRKRSVVSIETILEIFRRKKNGESVQNLADEFKFNLE